MKLCRFYCSVLAFNKRSRSALTPLSAVTFLGRTCGLCQFFISQEAIAHELFSTEPAANRLSATI